MGAGTGKGDNSLEQKILDPGGYVWDQSGDLPKAPDFNAAAQKQGASTRPNQTNNFASSQWSLDPKTGQWTQNVSLGGPLGAAAQGLQQQAAANVGKSLSGDAARDQAIQGAYSQAMSRLKPEWDQREQSTRAQLAAQGLDPTSEAATHQMDSFGRARNDAEMGAMNSAIGQGAEAGNALFQQNLQTQAQPYNQMSALKGLTSGFASGDQADPYSASAAAKYAADMEGYSAQQAGKNSKMQGASSGIGAAAAMFSDERMKTKIERSSVEALPGVPFASWEWKGLPGHREYGVIAQDLQRAAPEYVHVHPSGFLMVDYSFLEARNAR